MSRQSRRRRSAPAEEVEARGRHAAPAPPAGGLLALQRSAGNRAVARLLQQDYTLFAPRSWMDAKANDPDATSADSPMLTIRDLNTRKNAKLLQSLQTAWLAPEIELIEELEGDGIRQRVQPDLAEPPDPHDQRAQAKWLKEVRLKHESHRELVDVATLTPGTKPSGRPIHAPRDVVAGYSDLAGASANQLAVRWCVLVSLVKSEGKEGIRQFLQQQQDRVKPIPRPSDPDRTYYQALHDLFYGVRHIEYDDTANEATLLQPFGYTLRLVGPTHFEDLWKLQMRAGGRYIIDIVGHTMYVTMKRDFTSQADIAQAGGLLQLFQLHNDSDNWNWQEAVTLQKTVLSVYQRG